MKYRITYIQDGSTITIDCNSEAELNNQYIKLMADKKCPLFEDDNDKKIEKIESIGEEIPIDNFKSLNTMIEAEVNNRKKEKLKKEEIELDDQISRLERELEYYKLEKEKLKEKLKEKK